ncbi:hypothetical protein Vi05172_g5958 [Venturia inaequalis]|nr:hypothetical protein Vi05172_g5958 [Venturia inaequalis]
MAMDMSPRVPELAFLSVPVPLPPPSASPYCRNDDPACAPAIPILQLGEEKRVVVGGYATNCPLYKTIRRLRIILLPPSSSSSPSPYEIAELKHPRIPFMCLK